MGNKTKENSDCSRAGEPEMTSGKCREIDLKEIPPKPANALPVSRGQGRMRKTAQHTRAPRGLLSGRGADQRREICKECGRWIEICRRRFGTVPVAEQGNAGKVEDGRALVPLRMSVYSSRLPRFSPARLSTSTAPTATPNRLTIAVVHIRAGTRLKVSDVLFPFFLPDVLLMRAPIETGDTVVTCNS